MEENGRIYLSSTRQVDTSGETQFDTQAGVIVTPPVQRNGEILLSGGGEGNVQLSGTLDASRIQVTAGASQKGSGTVSVAAGETLTTNNGSIVITADDLILEGDLNSGTGDVFFGLADGGNLTLSPDGSNGADIGGNDLSHITANNLVLGSKGNIIVKGMNEESTNGISGSVFLISGNNIIFNVGASVFSALKIYALNNINVNQNITTTKNDVIAIADIDNDGKGNFNVAPGVIIASARDIDVSAPTINADNDQSFDATRDLILNGEVVDGGTPPVVPDPPVTSVEMESIEEGSLGTFLTEFFENGGSGGC